MIIGLSGKKQSGKSTMAAFLRRSIDGAVEINFADSVKRLCRDLFWVDQVNLSGSEAEKNVCLDAVGGLSGRRLMQRVGEFGRSIRPDCWVNAWQGAVMAQWAESGVAPVIVADVRYPNEVEAIRRQGGIVFRLTRAPLDDTHSSETALDHYRDWDAVIDNAFMTAEQANMAAAVECERLGVV